MDYNSLKLIELKEIAIDKQIPKISGLKKSELIELLQDYDAKDKLKKSFLEANINSTEEKSNDDEMTEEKNSGEKEDITGIFEAVNESNFGFLRFHNFMSSEKDVYVSVNMIKRYKLKTGDKIHGICKENSGEKFKQLVYVYKINDLSPMLNRNRPSFEKLIPYYPNERIILEDSSDNLSNRIIDLIAPIGKGQRGLIVAPPKAGKTMLLKEIASSITKKLPKSEVIVLLIDERPEEVTDIKESIDAEVIYSTFDELPTQHIKVSEMVLERAKRLVEAGKDVVILLDSITRLARASNLVIPSSGKILTGGLDPLALHMPKKFFGAARNIKDGGSLTILATALIDTGSRMDDVIFEEFKGTGNMEVHLDRDISQRRIFPAINIQSSGTRREDLLYTSNEIKAIYNFRKSLNKNKFDAIDALIELLENSKDNFTLINKMI